MAFPDFSNRTLLAVCAVFLAALPIAQAQDWQTTVNPHSPGPVPEPRPVHLKYNFGWNGIAAAAANFQLSKTADGHLKLDATGHTIGLARALWEYDVTHVSLTDAHTFRPVQVRETETFRSKKVDTEITFTPSGLTSKRDEIRGGSVKSKTRSFAFPSIDSIDSAVLYLRSQTLSPDAVQRLVVYPSTSAYLCTITPVGRERLNVPAGSYAAIKLDLQLSKIGGKGELLPHKKFRHAAIWLSDDSNRLVLRIEAQIFAGTVFTELQSAQFDDGKP